MCKSVIPTTVISWDDTVYCPHSSCDYWELYDEWLPRWKMASFQFWQVESGIETNLSIHQCPECERAFSINWD